MLRIDGLGGSSARHIKEGTVTKNPYRPNRDSIAAVCLWSVLSTAPAAALTADDANSPASAPTVAPASDPALPPPRIGFGVLLAQVGVGAAGGLIGAAVGGLVGATTGTIVSGDGWSKSAMIGGLVGVAAGGSIGAALGVDFIGTRWTPGHRIGRSFIGGLVGAVSLGVIGWAPRSLGVDGYSRDTMTLVGVGAGMLGGSIVGWYWTLEDDALPQRGTRVVPIVAPRQNVRGHVDGLYLGGAASF